MDIYHKISLLTTGSFAAANTVSGANSKVKGFMFVNTTAGPLNVDVFPYGATGATFSMRMIAPANTATNNIFPIKITGASCASGISVYTMF
jgi:hypothetical protein